MLSIHIKLVTNCISSFHAEELGTPTVKADAKISRLHTKLGTPIPEFIYAFPSTFNADPLAYETFDFTYKAGALLLFNALPSIVTAVGKLVVELLSPIRSGRCSLEV